MNNRGSTGIAAPLILLSVMLIAITAASVLTEETTSAPTDEDYEQMVEDAVNEISRYILVKEQIGKYSSIEGEQKIQKIVLWLTPLVSQDIDFSQMTIELINGESLMTLTYLGNSNPRENCNIFEHSIWDNLDGTNFALISIVDLDNSIVDYNTFNDASDNAYLVFKLPNDMAMNKYENMVVKLFPSSGVTRSIYIKAPIPINSVVTL